MKLELGKSYRDRMGNLVTITGLSDLSVYPFRSDNGDTWMENGKFREYDVYHDKDLIEEVQTNQEEEEMKHTFTMRCTLVLSLKNEEPTLEVYPVDQAWRQEAEVTVLDDAFELVLSSAQVERLLLNNLNKEVTRTKQAYELALEAVEGAHQFMRNL